MRISMNGLITDFWAYRGKFLILHLSILDTRNVRELELPFWENESLY